MIGLRRVGFLLLIAGLLAGQSAPGRAQTVEGIEQAWRAWMVKQGQRTGGMVDLPHDLSVARVSATDSSVVEAR